MTTPPATRISEARKQYTSQEWAWMTGRVAPLVVDPPKGGLASDEGMSHRHAAIMDIGKDQRFLTAFCVRLHKYLSSGEAFENLPEWVQDICGDDWPARQEQAVERIALAFEAGGFGGKPMQRIGGNEWDYATDAYWPYLEDLFDDVLFAVEWQMAYAKESE